MDLKSDASTRRASTSDWHKECLGLESVLIRFFPLPLQMMLLPSISQASAHLIVQRKCWKVDSARQTATNIPSCLSIVLVIVLPGVLALDRRVRDVEKRLEYQHSGGHIVAELRYLISCVP